LKSKLLNQMYRTPRLLARFFASSHLRRASISASSEIAIFANGMHYQDLTAEGFVLSKAEYWMATLQKVGIDFETILNPFSVRPRGKTARPLFSIEYLLLRSVVSFILHGHWKWVIDQCDPKGELTRTLKSKICVQIYFEFLRKNRVKVVMGIAMTPELCLVARFLNLPTFEFQHGAALIGELDVYGKYSKFPDFLFVWDDHYSRGRTNESSLINIGYPNDFSKQTTKENQLFGGRSLRVLVSMSYGDFNSADPTGFLNKDLVDPIEKVLLDGYEVYLRFHPAVFTGLEISREDSKLVQTFLHWKEKHRILQNAKIDKNDRLYDSLINVDIHFTFASSTVLEAAYCKVPSLLFCNEDDAPNIPSFLYDMGIVQYYRENFHFDETCMNTHFPLLSKPPNEELFLQIVTANL
jgi:hypothetical protein